MALSWWGHATLGIDVDGVRVLTDPVLRRWIGPLRRTGPMPRASAATGLDAVLISHGHHGHHGHLDVRSLRRIRRSTKVIVPVGRGALVRAEGFSDVVYLLRGSRTVWFAGDTGVFEGMDTLRGRIDVALVPTGGWGPVAMPIHWGTFAAPGLRMARPLATPGGVDVRAVAGHLNPTGAGNSG